MSQAAAAMGAALAKCNTRFATTNALLDSRTSVLNGSNVVHPNASRAANRCFSMVVANVP